jgi:hypothetical protein
MDAAGEVDDSGVADLLKELCSALAAGARAALNNDFAIAVDLVEVAEHFDLRDKLSADLSDLVTARFADVEDEDVLPRRSDLGNRYRRSPHSHARTTKRINISPNPSAVGCTF